MGLSAKEPKGVGESNVRLLVVEDLLLMRMALEDALRHGGYRHVASAANGVEALELFEETLFDCVITDWQMPEMDGLEMIACLRATERGRKVPVLMLSAETRDHKIAQAYDAGVDRYVTKPFKLGALLDTVETMLGS